MDVFIVEDICECKASCQNSTTGCEFLSFDNATNICTETSTCATVDSTCADCRWMPKVCGNEGTQNSESSPSEFRIRFRRHSLKFAFLTLQGAETALRLARVSAML